MKRKRATKREAIEQLTRSHKRLLRLMRGQIRELGQLRQYVLEMRAMFPTRSEIIPDATESS